MKTETVDLTDTRVRNQSSLAEFGAGPEARMIVPADASPKLRWLLRGNTPTNSVSVRCGEMTESGLEVAAATARLENNAVFGLAFTLFSSRATWGCAGVRRALPSLAGVWLLASRAGSHLVRVLTRLP
jgi:hypothetical protein